LRGVLGIHIKELQELPCGNLPDLALTSGGRRMPPNRKNFGGR
jgi:hypothetical protein